jgi:hypothetical protein
MDNNSTESCQKCGAAMELVQPLNPAFARCPVCGHELLFIWDPPPPVDPYGDADGVLVIESFNGNDMRAAVELRRTLQLTPAEALELVRTGLPRIPWPWSKLWGMYDLKERLDKIGVSSRTERVRRR